MIRLRGANDFLQMKLAGAIATSNPSVYIAWRVLDGEQVVDRREQVVALSGTADVTLLGANAAENQYLEVDEIRLVNTDTAAVTFILEHDDTVTETELAHVAVGVNSLLVLD